MGKTSSAAQRIQARRKQIVRLFYEHGNLSKNDIFKMTRYSFSTVISTVDAMCADGIIVPAESGQGNVGRPALYYSLRPDYGYTVGVDINASSVTLSLVDFRREAVRTLSRPIPSGKPSLQAVIEWIPALTGELTAGISPMSLLCVGVAAPGLIDRDTGRILRYAPFPEEENIELVSFLESQFHCRVFIDKSLNCLATAYKKTCPHKLDNMLLISMRTGVGMSSILNGSIYHGSNGLAGEIGSMRLPGVSAGLHNAGGRTLDTELSIYSIARKLDAVFGETTGENGEPLSAGGKVDLFVELVKNGQPDCIRILDALCYDLGYCVSQVIHLLDPSDVLFYGELTQCGDVFLEHLKQYITSQGSGPQPRLGIANLSRYAFAEGAAYFALEQYLQPNAALEV